ncbi:MAG: PqqA family [Paucimonas sp.]|jgi:coenzyme PQQ precursor peptide PqqA|nr:PqqA family [Paucimonas sp.]
MIYGNKSVIFLVFMWIFIDDLDTNIPGTAMIASFASGFGATTKPKSACNRSSQKTTEETVMQWTKPSFTDLRFGFEITMYIANR